MIKEVTRNRQWETTGFSGMSTRRGDPPRTKKELPEEQSWSKTEQGREVRLKKAEGSVRMAAEHGGELYSFLSGLSRKGCDGLDHRLPYTDFTMASCTRSWP